MADRSDRTRTGPGRAHGAGDDLSTAETTRTSDVPNPHPAEERPSGLLSYIKLQLRILSTAVILAIIFLAVIILFATTR